MGHFYGEIQGNRGEATRTGTKNSGMDADVGGWSVGVRVSCRHCEATGKDEIHIYKTSGSNGRHGDEFIMTIKKEEE